MNLRLMIWLLLIAAAPRIFNATSFDSEKCKRFNEIKIKNISYILYIYILYMFMFSPTLVADNVYNQSQRTQR